YVQQQLFAAPLTRRLRSSAAKIVERAVPGLTASEASVVADYTLGGMARDDEAAAEPNATAEMQETQMSFNMQYLQLQTQMQSKNPSFTALSNILKTKHDTVKNS